MSKRKKKSDKNRVGSDEWVFLSGPRSCAPKWWIATLKVYCHKKSAVLSFQSVIYGPQQILKSEFRKQKGIEDDEREER